MEAIKLPQPNLTAIPGYDPEQMILQLGRARYDNEVLRAKNAALELKNRELTMEVQRLQIELSLKRDEVARLSELSATAAALKPKRMLDFSDIVSLVCAYRGTTEEKLKSQSRLRSLVYARNLCYYFCYEYGKEGVVQMGRYFDRDHSTAVYGRKYIADKMPFYDDIKQDVEYLTEKIESIINA